MGHLIRAKESSRELVRLGASADLPRYATILPGALRAPTYDDNFYCTCDGSEYTVYIVH